MHKNAHAQTSRTLLRHDDDPFGHRAEGDRPLFLSCGISWCKIPNTYSSQNACALARMDVGKLRTRFNESKINTYTQSCELRSRARTLSHSAHLLAQTVHGVHSVLHNTTQHWVLGPTNHALGCHSAIAYS